jgi:hypothetical protein
LKNGQIYNLLEFEKYSKHKNKKTLKSENQTEPEKKKTVPKSEKETKEKKKRQNGRDPFSSRTRAGVNPSL